MTHSTFHSHCPMCGVSTSGDTEHATLVIDQNIVCKDPVCQKQAQAYLMTREKTLELGMVPFRPDQYQLPLRLEPG